MAMVTSASGLLAMLDEEQDALKIFALKNLIFLVDQFWAEISANISTIESLYEDEIFKHREAAALLASKVFYHLGELNDSLTYALGAGPLFDISEDSEYVETLVAKSIDEYVALNIKAAETRDETIKLDPRLVAIVEKMLDKCINEGQYQQAVGIALECRRLDKLEEAILRSSNVPEMLDYCLRTSQTIVNRREFRHSVLQVLVKLYQTLESPDYASVCQCLMFLDDSAGVAAILDRLLKKDSDGALLAYQIAFELFENEFQQFLLSVRDLLPNPEAQVVAPAPAAAVAAEASMVANAGAPPTDTAAAAERGDAMDTSEDKASASSAGPGSAAAEGVDGAVGSAAPPPPTLSPEEKAYIDRLSKLKGILSGMTPISLGLQFLYRNNRSDLLILKNIKQAVEMRNSVCHSATIFSNAIMHAGTTVDTFLRENLDWLSRATNWAKFSATAGLGVIHRGHLQQGRSLMAPYLPQNGVSGSPYSEGGALYALGLIHANHGEGIKGFLLESLRNTSNEVIQHGACLGLGLAALGTADEEIYEEVKNVLYTDSAVAGEAAGIAMGLLLVGTASEKAGEMLTYGHETQHEKIKRGLALGLALVDYGREEEADTLIEQMTRDQDPILRYGGMYALGMAYRGTANNGAIRRLLHFAVSDVSDDVRRAAVLCLGFVLCGEPEQTPKIVSLLSESYNAHVRYGAAMAVGVSCAGTAQADAIALLEPLTSDAVDFVRQGALIAMAMVLQQASEAREPAVGTFRRQLDKVISDKHEDTMSKMGAILAAGLLDAGGRNVSIMLRSRTGHDRVTAIVGMAVFTQFWYWYPLTYFVSLAFAPTAFVGLNENLKIPKFELVSDVRPALFGYPPPIETTKTTTAAKAPTAVLSTAMRAKSKAKKDAEKALAAVKGAATGSGGAPSSGVVPSPSPASLERDASKDVVEAMEVEGAPSGPSTSKEPEPTSERLSNPARVLPAQERYIAFPADSRYQPVKKVHSGIVMLKDTRPGEPEELVADDSLGNPAAAPATATENGAPPPVVEEDEPPPPEAFEYVPS